MTSGSAQRNSLVVVTGGGSGIGRETALAFARQAARVVVADINLDTANETVGLVEKLGGTAHPYALDVSDESAVTAFADEVCATHGVPDVLINNAGIGQAGRFFDTPSADFQRVLNINLNGVVYGCRAFGPRMAERKSGHIVNISSAAAYTPIPEMGAYATSKAAVFMFSDVLRGELARAKVKVSTICPGIVNTNIIRTTQFSGLSAEDEAKRQRQGAGLYAKRGYGPEKVAKGIVNAVLKGKSVVPVTPEAHMQYHLSRLAPALNRLFWGSLGNKLNK
ncbi:oxidoreductase EphD [Mycolicibacterium phlei]|uniref:SDR family NAD(P)-dependent oxidoreductase n=1 Tax=Mycobacteroides chelonae TaxID=1774 RepID=UPI0006189B9B|nr:SDR family NAD(P)-dependent oxidoreductase [Mycobacteroides chelonae]VEG14200.1 oxidoreductase EphD [Mycolicibacterium phlei]AKC37332.1 oxidoreductase [Mycobacteroides chelonae]ANA96359.1 oxidoreductase [Mycobacteroides chelonae CCUG 47445]OLT81488.1 oxidoreductase [Mycobacteroides chelonae]ORV17522.1 oxidoreductase [Mycobacteroides chelonae]